MDDLTKLSGPELAERMEELNLSESGCTRGYAIVEAVQAYLRNDDRVAMRNLERERDTLRERVRELEEEITGSDCDDAHEWLEMLYQGSESRGNPHGFAWTIKNELQFASMEIGNLKSDRDEWRTQHENLLAMNRAAESTINNQRKELHSLNVERKATLTKLEDAQRRIAELEAQLREALHGKSYGYPVTAQTEPAERKAQEERKYGSNGYDPMTLDEVLAEEFAEGSQIRELAIHLRETLATLDAVRALAEKYKRAMLPYDIEAELLEVLNGKR